MPRLLVSGHDAFVRSMLDRSAGSLLAALDLPMPTLLVSVSRVLLAGWREYMAGAGCQLEDETRDRRTAAACRLDTTVPYEGSRIRARMATSVVAVAIMYISEVAIAMPATPNCRMSR